MYHKPWIDETEPDESLAENYPTLMVEIRRVLPTLTPDQQLIVAELVTQTCPGCHQAWRSDCYCTRDD